MDKVGQGGPDGVEDSVHIGGKELPPLPVGDVGEQHLGQGDARVADQGVQSPEGGAGGLHQGLGFVRPGHISTNRQGGAAGGLNPAADLPGLGLAAEIVHPHLPAPAAEFQSDSGADASGGAGDEDGWCGHKETSCLKMQEPRSQNVAGAYF